MCVVAGWTFEKEHVPAETRRKGLRCLNNILVLAEPLRQVFANEKYPLKVVEILREGDAEDELAACNLLVLASAQTEADLTPYFEVHDLAGIINKVGLVREPPRRVPRTDNRHQESRPPHEGRGDPDK
jgi:hypothetical protein